MANSLNVYDPSCPLCAVSTDPHDLTHTNPGLFRPTPARPFVSPPAYRPSASYQAEATPAPMPPEDPKIKRDAKRKKILKKMSDIVLPEDVKRDIVAQVVMHEEKNRLFNDWGLGEVIKYGRATAILMWGGPGTGKTYTAHKIAEALGVKLVSVMFGEIQSPMPGEYETNLRRKFDEATRESSVLFLDECDGIIQSRTGMGQIMSAENNYLLQQIEKFEGIIILATNRITTLDEALERRLSLIVEVPAPDEKARAAIWQKHLPKKMPLGEGVSVDVLAKFDLTGGLIKNVVLNAARYAISADSKKVESEHFARAIEKTLAAQKAFASPRETGHQQGVTKNRG